ncbi:type I polyketide synthase [Kitasatospora sp. NPDC015120]|uniref:type I polyketide synthase n=1 Tax=Kitasatospora sp. NPDC015120 TaxID=3364023 RepID=UPI0036F46335
MPTESSTTAAPGERTRAPIAVMGMDCRFTGPATSPEGLWRMLAAGEHSARELPQDRGWKLEGLYDPDHTVEGTTYLRAAGFLDDVAGFDAEVFGIGPREASAMDPQQRLLLESTWHALERARIAPRSLRGSRTGVYVGMNDSGYGQLTGNAPAGLESYLLTGTQASVASGRIAYALGLNGPAITVDTACSSSLVALHLAVQALRAGDCDVAIAAGATVIASPEQLKWFSRLKVYAADGRCKAFAAEADGFAPAEGVAAVVLMPWERARAAGYPVLALVRGSAINQDGASDRLTTPSGPAQQAVILAALGDAGLEPGDIGVVEAHGPGTRAGDPVEAASLQACYGRHRTPEDPLWIGSVKTNIGHTTAVAGLAGVVKMVLALQHEHLPATLHAQNPTPAVDWSAGTMRLLREPRPWPRGPRPRRAGVLAYGISGTNAHVVLEEPPAEPPTAAPARAPGGHRSGSGGAWKDGTDLLLWPLSGAGEEGLRAQAARLARYVRETPAVEPADVAWSLATTRSPLPYRGLAVGGGVDELLDGLDGLARGEASTAAVTGKALPGTAPVFVFPGQGAQWPGMAAALLEASPAFASALRACGAALRPWLDADIVDVACGSPGAPPLDRAEYVQPALFAVYVALAELWRAHGVRPAAVIGHSQGEIAAAHVAGVLSLKEAARVVALRSRALRHLTSRGGMASLAAPAATAALLIAPWAGRVEVAVENGPAATVVAGDTDALAEVLEGCAREGVHARRLPVDYASHSPHMEAVREEVLALLGDVACGPGHIPVFSATLGRRVDHAVLDAGYWYRNLRETVRFDAAVREAVAAGHRQFVEVSPHPVLAAAVGDILADAGVEGAVVPTLYRDQGGARAFATALARANACDMRLDWGALYPGARTVDLPVHAFQHRRHWLPAEPTDAGLRDAGLAPLGHPWLAAALDLPDGGTVFTGSLSLSEHPWLGGHVVHGTVLLPATGVLELLLRAADRLGCERLEDIVLRAPLALPSRGAVDIRVSCAPRASDRHALTLHSRGALGGWTCHAQATGAGAVETETRMTDRGSENT